MRVALRPLVSIPFIAGQWSLLFIANLACREPCYVSIPFIAGQWSLHWCTLRADKVFRFSFNPLHCGAVVASFSQQDTGYTQ